MIVPTMKILNERIIGGILFLVLGVVLGVAASKIGEDKMVEDLKLQLGGGNLVCREKLTDCRSIVQADQMSISVFNQMVYSYGNLATHINQDNVSGVVNDRIAINSYNDKITKFGEMVSPLLDNCLHE